MLINLRGVGKPEWVETKKAKRKAEQEARMVEWKEERDSKRAEWAARREAGKAEKRRTKRRKEKIQKPRQKFQTVTTQYPLSVTLG